MNKSIYKKFIHTKTSQNLIQLPDQWEGNVIVSFYQSFSYFIDENRSKSEFHSKIDDKMTISHDQKSEKIFNVNFQNLHHKKPTET